MNGSIPKSDNHNEQFEVLVDQAISDVLAIIKQIERSLEKIFNPVQIVSTQDFATGKIIEPVIQLRTAVTDDLYSWNRSFTPILSSLAEVTASVVDPDSFEDIYTELCQRIYVSQFGDDKTIYFVTDKPIVSSKVPTDSNFQSLITLYVQGLPENYIRKQ